MWRHERRTTYMDAFKGVRAVKHPTAYASSDCLTSAHFHTAMIELAHKQLHADETEHEEEEETERETRKRRGYISIEHPYDELALHALM